MPDHASLDVRQRPRLESLFLQFLMCLGEAAAWSIRNHDCRSRNVSLSRLRKSKRVCGSKREDDCRAE
jgi:hypothetical protein